MLLRVRAHRILNSAGNPTVEVSAGGFVASVPSGTSKGRHEAQLLGFRESVQYINKLKEIKIGSLQDIEAFEKNHEASKANILPVSLAFLKALAAGKKKAVWQLLGKKQKPLLINKIIGGGLHAKGGPEFQEFLAIPTSLSLTKNLGAAYTMHEEIGRALNVSGRDLEGGWAAKVDNYTALRTLQRAADRVKANTGVNVRLGVDIAASSFYKDGTYNYGEKKYDPSKQIDFVLGLIKEFDLLYVEDPMHEDDFEGFAEIRKSAKDSMICGDDLTVTNPERLETANKYGSVNSVIVKHNQIGYLYRLKQFSDGAKRYKYDRVVSHRSQETNDDVISDICVGLGCKYMKIGLFGGERVAKINRLLEIFGE
jgi:enolase